MTVVVLLTLCYAWGCQTETLTSKKYYNILCEYISKRSKIKSAIPFERVNYHQHLIQHHKPQHPYPISCVYKLISLHQLNTSHGEGMGLSHLHQASESRSTIGTGAYYIYIWDQKPSLCTYIKIVSKKSTELIVIPPIALCKK